MSFMNKMVAQTGPRPLKKGLSFCMPTIHSRSRKQFLPKGYKPIIVHFVFAVKHDFRHKARLVAGGHITDSTTHGTNSGVASL
jgi:hypothetical protein